MGSSYNSFGFSGTALALVVTAFLASLLAQPVSAYYFENYVRWANQAVNGGPAGQNCSLAAVGFLDFVYVVVEQAAPTVGTAQLSRACTSCSEALDASLTFLPSNTPNVCPLLPDATKAGLTGLALRRFVCFGAESISAGACVVQVVNALKSVGLLERVSTLDPTLAFSGPLLPLVCEALFPAPPQPASCCGRSWAYLMAALAQQSCLPSLSHEYASLPGRCEAVQNRTAPGFCESSWPSDLLPLLAPPSAALCGSVPGWLNGSACSAAQLTLSGAPGSVCDLWCGLVGEMGRIATGEIPGPQGTGNDNSTTSGTPSANRGGGGGGGGSKKLQTSTLTIVCVFSVLIALLLLVLAVFGRTLYKENRAIKREAYQFDSELQHAEVEGQPEETNDKAPPPPPGPAGGAAAAAVAAPGAPTSAPATPVAARSLPSIPADAAAAAAAGGIMLTPKYAPGPTPSAPAAAAAAAAAVGSGSQAGRASAPAATARALVFDDAAGLSSGAAAAAAATAGDTASRSSRYESATSLFGDPTKSTGGLLGYSTPAAAGSTGNLMVTAAATSVTSATSMTAAAAAAAAAGAPLDKLRSHRLSLTDSETTASMFHTAHSPESGLFTGAAPGGGGGGEHSGSYMTVRSTTTASSVTTTTATTTTSLTSPTGGGGGGGGVVSATGKEAFKRARSAGTAAALTMTP